MEAKKCVNCGLVAYPSDTECRRCGTYFSVYPPQPATGAMPGSPGGRAAPYGSQWQAPSYGSPPPGTVFPGAYSGSFSGNLDVWREGSKLVMRRSATLPDRCIKCNAPTGGSYVNRKLNYLNPVWYLLLIGGLVGWIALIIVRFGVRKTAYVDLGLCSDDVAKHKTAITVSILLAVAGVLGLIVAIRADSGLLAGIAALLILAGMIYGLAKGQLVTVSKIDDDYIWIGGVSKEFLSSLPASR